jgi:hypothetical protein
MLRKIFSQPWLFIINALLIGVVTAFAPLEKSLGANVRLVYFHGAWVWAGKLAFAAAALVGLGGLVLRHWLKPAWASRLPAWALAFGRSGLFFWATYLPMSLLVMQLNWGGLFLDEPRFRTPLTFGVVGLLLHAGFYFFDNQPDLVSLGSLAFGAALWVALGETSNILHPDSPIFTSDSLNIQLFFILLLGLSVLIGWQITRWLYGKIK